MKTQEVVAPTPVRESSHAVPAGGERQLVHVAIVYAADEVREILVTVQSKRLWSDLARYVEENARMKLWPKDAETVLDLLNAGRVETSVEMYFDRVGLRWDRERLHLDVVEVSEVADVYASDATGRRTGPCCTT